MNRLLYALLSIWMIFGNLVAQHDIYDKKLLPAVRAAAEMIPGALPKAVNVLKIAQFSVPLSYAIEGQGNETVEGVHTMFQVRFPDGWIMVDVSGDKELLGEAGFSDEAFQQSMDALLGARLIITTHEDHDHIWRLIHGPYAERYAAKAILTREQVHTLMTKPNQPQVKLSEEQANRFLAVAYDRFLPIAPGVVLIKAPGHTPGGQMVYVRVKTGQEVILTGDVTWQKMGIDRGLQRPDSVTARRGEDRKTIASQLEWLRAVESMGVTNVVFHDLVDIEELIEQGILGNGAELQ